MLHHHIATDVQMTLLFPLLAGSVAHLSENCSSIYEDPTSFSFNISHIENFFNLYSFATEAELKCKEK